MLVRARIKNSAQQIRLPLCEHCGRPHDRRTFDKDYKPLCQACEDRQTVETLWRYNGTILDAGDPEGTLDRLYSAFPELFERGVLPDAWFQLVQQKE